MLRQCANIFCDNEFEAKRIDHVYCSKKCSDRTYHRVGRINRQKPAESPKIITCALEGCENTFAPKTGGKKYCCKKHTDRASQIRKASVERACKQCGVMFVIGAHRSYCSDECLRDSQNAYLREKRAKKLEPQTLKLDLSNPNARALLYWGKHAGVKVA